MTLFKTVAPFQDLRLGRDKSFQLAPGTFFAPLPDSVRKDKHILKYLGQTDQNEWAACTHCFLSEYEVDEAAEKEKESRLKEGVYRAPLGIKADEVHFANLAVWLRCLPFISFSFIVHIREGVSDPPLRVDRFLYSEGNNQRRPITTEDLEAVQTLYAALCKLPRHTAPWTAARALTAALQMQRNEIAHLLLWIALEALFGVADGEIKYRLSQRLAFFLADNRTEARDLFASAKHGYDVRCKIAHGSWGLKTLGTKDNLAVTKSTENFLRRAFLRLLQNNDIMVNFTAKDETRCAYLDDLLFEI